WRLFRIGTAMLFIIVALFFTHEIFHLAPSTVAVISAIILLFLGGPKMPTILERVEWRTLIFFACLFIVVGGLEKTGTIAWIAADLSKYIAGSSWVAVSAVLWLSSLVSGFIDNVPFVAAFIPVIRDYGSISGLDVFPLWWSMAIGAGFGGNGTMIGASSNIVAIGAADKRGVKFTFYEFTRRGLQVAVLSTIVANLMLVSAFVL
ncbi:SLC13 family permease, partial [[Eubacterium] cellulosolvens]